MNEPTRNLLEILQAGVQAVRPSLILNTQLKSKPDEFAFWLENSRRALLTMGKAAVDSAHAILQAYDCEKYFVLSPFPDPAGMLRVDLGNHPIPSQQSSESTTRLIEWIHHLGTSDALLVVLSGGSSALCVSPLDSLTLASKMQVNDLLIKSGASIQEMNTVRKHLSKVKGGQLGISLKNVPCSVLVISDVIGNDFSVIGSGPFYSDPTSFQDAYAVLKRYQLLEKVPLDARETIERGMAGLIPETPKSIHSQIPHSIVASNETARQTAAQKAIELGYDVDIFEGSIQGDVTQAAEKIVPMLPSPGKVWIAGGEVTVKVKGNGTGGRNQHLALILAEKIRGAKTVFAAAGTDGIDGNSDAAGAWIDGATYDKLSIQEHQNALLNCDSYSYFQKLGQNIVTGPSGTNVMDLYIAVTL